MSYLALLMALELSVVELLAERAQLVAEQRRKGYFLVMAGEPAVFVQLG